jgi:hypothetical protein
VLADLLLTDKHGREVCKLSSVQTSIAQVFRQRRSSLFERLFHADRSENALFLVTLGLHYDMKSVTMLAIGHVIDLRVPREWDTALTLTTLRLDFAIWRDHELEQPFAAEFHEYEIPKQDIDALFQSVRKYQCEVSMIEPAGMKKVNKICRVIAAGFKSWTNQRNIQDISDSLGSAIRTIVNSPNK